MDNDHVNAFVYCAIIFVIFIVSCIILYWIFYFFYWYFKTYKRRKFNSGLKKAYKKQLKTIKENYDKGLTDSNKQKDIYNKTK